MKPHQVCSRCIMDTTVPEIVFDEHGVCQFCKIHDEMEKAFPTDLGEREILFHKKIAEIKKAGRGKKYDCICGVSGGRDSTWLIYQMVKFGLRPLAVHFDNGWNSELAVTNIKFVCDKLNVDLETFVMDWEEFRELQLSFLKASTADVEIPTDVGIYTILHEIAKKEGIKYILSGHAFRTEGISPLGWTYMDGKYIDQVHKIFTGKKLKYFPNFHLWDAFYFTFINRIELFPILNLLPYNQKASMKEMEEVLSWRYAGGHHHESYYTKFIQSYLLPQKFQVDKRKTELSALIRSGQTTRQNALEEVTRSEYQYDPTLIEYVINKLQITKDEWDKIYSLPVKSFRDYPTYFPFLMLMKFPILIMTKLNLIPRLMYMKFWGS